MYDFDPEQDPFYRDDFSEESDWARLSLGVDFPFIAEDSDAGELLVDLWDYTERAYRDMLDNETQTREAYDEAVYRYQFLHKQVDIARRFVNRVWASVSGMELGDERTSAIITSLLDFSQQERFRIAHMDGLDEGERQEVDDMVATLSLHLFDQADLHFLSAKQRQAEAEPD